MHTPVDTESSVWVVTQDLIVTNPVVGVFATRDEATAYLDDVASRHPEMTFECARYVLGEGSV